MVMHAKKSGPPYWFFCRGCGTRKVNAPMLIPEVWQQASSAYPRCVTISVPSHDLLCLSCVEKALGRYVQVDDLLDCPGNSFVRIMVDRIRKGVI